MLIFIGRELFNCGFKDYAFKSLAYTLINLRHYCQT
jgi:hypothetical protein